LRENKSNYHIIPFKRHVFGQFKWCDFSFKAKKKTETVPFRITLCCLNDVDTEHVCCFITVCALQIDIGLIIDSSQSDDDRKALPRSIIQFVQRFVEGFDISPTQTRVGVIQFSQSGMLTFGFTAYSTLSSLLDRLDTLTPTGPNRSLADAFRASHRLFEGGREGVSKIALLVMDGAPDLDISSTIPEAHLTEELGVEVFVLGITNKVGTQNTRTMLFLCIKTRKL
jgi:von Willebrand factor type A domain